MSSISVKRVYLCLMVVIYLMFLFVKENFGEPTPDEVFYTSGVVNPDDLSLKFFITQFALRSLYNINQYLYPIVNLLVALYIFNYLYKREVLENRHLDSKTLALIFFLPSVIYFSCAYLRDIYIFYIATAFVFASSIQNSKWRWWMFLIALTILRYEAGLIIILAYLINALISKKRKTYFRLSVLSLPFIFVSAWILLVIMLENNLIWQSLETMIYRYEKKSTGYGIFQMPISQESIMFGSIANWVAFYAPFLFKPIKSAFEVFMFLDSVIVGFLFFRVFFCFKKWSFYRNPLYRISLIVFFGTFFLAIPESVPETMYRHRMAYLPFLFFLNFHKQ